MTETQTTTEIKEYHLRRDGERSLRFRGELLGSGSSRSHQGPRQNRWTEIEIYRTTGGKLVAQVCRRTLWENEEDRHTCYVCATGDELVGALYDNGGQYLGDASKEALRDAGIDYAEEID